MYPFKFKPILKETLWGGNRIALYKGLTTHSEKIGESWEISGVREEESVIANGEDKGKTLKEAIRTYRADLLGEDNYALFGDQFPLLIKYIDATKDLSIQVHPSDELAQERHHSLGKSEMWYVVSAEEGATVKSGFTQEITPKEYKSRVFNNTITEIIKEHPVKAGDVFYLPAGRVHSIGAGTLLLEIQQASDITYRIYDYNRVDEEGNRRELHINLAEDAIDFEVYDDYKTDYEAVLNEPIELVASPHFTTSMYDIDEEITCDYLELDSFVVYNCIEGNCVIRDENNNSVSLNTGETVLIPAILTEVKIIPDGRVKLLETYV